VTVSAKSVMAGVFLPRAWLCSGSLWFCFSWLFFLFPGQLFPLVSDRLALVS